MFPPTPRGAEFGVSRRRLGSKRWRDLRGAHGTVLPGPIRVLRVLFPQLEAAAEEFRW